MLRCGIGFDTMDFFVFCQIQLRIPVKPCQTSNVVMEAIEFFFIYCFIGNFDFVEEQYLLCNNLCLAFTHFTSYHFKLVLFAGSNIEFLYIYLEKKYKTEIDKCIYLACFPL